MEEEQRGGLKGEDGFLEGGGTRVLLKEANGAVGRGCEGGVIQGVLF